MLSKLTFIAAIAIITTLAASATAAADIRYASPTGSGPANTCEQLDPCSLLGALDGDETFPGDEVILSTGDYAVDSQLSVPSEVIMRGSGLPSQTRLIASTSSTPLLVWGNDSTVTDLEIVAGTASGQAAISVIQSTIRRVIARNSSGIGCDIRTPLITETVCATAADASTALYLAGGGSNQPVLRNVTAVATHPNAGMGIYASSIGAGAIVDIDAKSVIARGQTTDVATVQDAGATTTVTLSYSNFATTDVTGGGTVTAPGTANNQTAAPIFVEAGNSDFRQAGTSPTIDAGITDVNSGLTDLLGAARTQGAGTDIGAYETVRPPATEQTPPAVPDTRKPIVKFRSKPRKKSTKRKVRIRFSADEKVTFRCKLDRAKYRTCKSPYVKTVKPGRHKLRVYATDAAGNKSKSVVVSWTVKKLKS